MKDGSSSSIARFQNKESLRETLYEEFDIPWTGRIIIFHIIPILERNVEAGDRYDTSPRSEILAEIALYEAYVREPKFKLFISLGAIIGFYDFLHPLPSQVYGILFVGLASINGLTSSLRSPKMIAAELESETDDNGMPADYRAKAISSVATNVTIVLLGIAVAIQVLITSSVIPSEAISVNYAVGTVIQPEYTMAFLLVTLYLIGNVRKDIET